MSTPEPVEASRAPLVEHLRELRKRLVISAIAVGIGFGIAWTWVEQVFQALLLPLQNATEFKELANMHHRNLTEPFFVLLKTAIFAGVILAIPVILLQIWKFVAPGLYPNEKKVAIPFVLAGTTLFLLGGWFCYDVILPNAYGFLLKFGDKVTTPELMMEEYLGLTTKMILAFGAIFEMPVFATFLARIGVIDHKILLKFWRHAIVLCFVTGAMLTPPDIISQVFLAGPMIVLYFISVGCAFVFHKRKPTEEELG